MTVDKFGRSRESKVQETTASALDVTNMRGNLHMNGNRVTGLPTGLKKSSSDAVSWGQADLLISHGIRGHVKKPLGIVCFEELCRLCSSVISKQRQTEISC